MNIKLTSRKNHFICCHCQFQCRSKPIKSVTLGLTHIAAFTQQYVLQLICLWCKIWAAWPPIAKSFICHLPVTCHLLVCHLLTCHLLFCHLRVTSLRACHLSDTCVSPAFLSVTCVSPVYHLLVCHPLQPPQCPSASS